MGLFDFVKKSINSYQNNDAITYGKINCNEVFLSNDIADKLKQKYVAFDIETTGLDPIQDRIVEIGAVLFENRISTTKFGTLVNPNKAISEDAIRVNNISNEMINSSPTESEVYPKFISFLGDVLSGEIIICAHNAKFDISFLKNTLERLGYSGTINYIDTLTISRNVLYLDNYKQSTIADYFNIENKEAHRAVSDAEVCGIMLSKLLEYEIVEKRSKNETFVRELIPLDEFENIVYAYVIKIINNSNLNLDYLSVIKNKSGYVDFCCYYPFIRFKFAKKGKYFIVPSKYLKDITLPNEPCNVSEGGNDFLRVYFRGLNDLELLKDVIISEFNNTCKMLKEYTISEDEVINYSNSLSHIPLDDAITIIDNELNDKKLDNYLSDFSIEERVSRDDLTINPVNERIPLNQIKNLNNWEKGYDEGIKYWIKGDELRKSGKYHEAIKQFDLSRYNGYLAHSLYESYAMAYHQLKDYDNEIDILEEGIERLNKDGNNTSELVSRRDKAVQLMSKLKEKEEIEKKKELVKIEKEEQKRIYEEQKKIKEKQIEEDNKVRAEKRERNLSIPVNARIIIQKDDNNNVIQTYPSIAEAVRQTGINSKSIRDAANGVQKHAGGYVWEYGENSE